MTAQSFILWECKHGEPIAARIAIAGDFLPAGALVFPPGLRWRETAGNLAPYFADIAATFVNLESSIGAEGLPARPLIGIGEIVTAPEASLDYLDALHCRAVGLANNHSYDFGVAGVARTREAIASRGMIPLGAGRNLNDAPELFVWHGPGDTRIGFWAAAKATSDSATHKTSGVEPATLDRARRALKLMKSDGTNFCVALLHAGCLRTNRPDPEDLRQMDLLVESGFDVVATSHSHRISGCKQLDTALARPSFCFYGLGSIVSGYIAGPMEREGLVVVAGLNGRGELTRIEVRPVLLDEGGFGKIPSAEMSRIILDRFKSLTREIEDGSYERLFYEDVAKGLVQLYIRDVGRAYREGGVQGLARKAMRLRGRHVRRILHKVTG